MILTYYSLIEKFMKHFFLLKDNIIDKKLVEIIKQQTFSSRKHVNRQINEVIDFFAANFTEGNRDQATKLLEQHNAPLRTKDASLMSYFGGMLTMIMLALIVVSIVPFERDP